MNEQKKCENVYVRYVQAIENYYGRESLEVANAYYLVGVFYFEQKLLNKAAACFTKSLNVVQKKLGKDHQACSDSLLSLGVVYKL